MAITVSVISYFYPTLLSPLENFIVPLLGLVMLGMGMTLRLENFIEVCRRPKLIIIGVCLQFLLMPLFASFVGTMLDLDNALLVGLVIVGSCPGGTASNVICYLARGDVALSITLTTVSTVLAVFLTPLLSWFYIGHMVPVPVVNMIMDIARIILLPVATGVVINQYLGRHLHVLKRLFPFVSVTSIVLIIGIIMALTQPQLHLVALPVITAVVWHNLFGLVSGYYLCRIFGYDPRICRTIAIEVGMQNSGLGVALAKSYFSAIAALPGAIFSVWHNISGAVIAGYWLRKTNVMQPEEPDPL